MKKFASIVLVCLMCLLSMNLFASAEDATVSGTLSSVPAKPGDSVDVILSISANTDLQSIGYTGLEYDNTALIYDSAEWLLNGGSGKIMDNAGVYAFENVDSSVSGEVLKIKFNVADDAKDGQYNVKLTLSAGKVDGSKPAVTVAPATVTVKGEEKEPATVNVKGTISNAVTERGKTVSVNLSVEADSDLQSIGYTGLSYDKSALIFDSAEWLLTGGSGKVMDDAGVYAFENIDSKISGNVLKINFKVDSNAKDGDYNVNLALSAGKVDGTNVTATVIPGIIKVESQTTTTKPSDSTTTTKPSDTTTTTKPSDTTTTTEVPPVSKTTTPSKGGSIPKTGDAGVSLAVAGVIAAMSVAGVAIIMKKRNDD